MKYRYFIFSKNYSRQNAKRGALRGMPILSSVSERGKEQEEEIGVLIIERFIKNTD
jgi:hypothetical protein